MTEKNNIETAHQDLIQDYNQLRDKSDKQGMQNRTMKLEAEEMNNRIEHLKKTILRQYERTPEEDLDGDKDEALRAAKMNVVSMMVALEDDDCIIKMRRKSSSGSDFHSAGRSSAASMDKIDP